MISKACLKGKDKFARLFDFRVLGVTEESFKGEILFNFTCSESLTLLRQVDKNEKKENPGEL